MICDFQPIDEGCKCTRCGKEYKGALCKAKRECRAATVVDKAVNFAVASVRHIMGGLAKTQQEERNRRMEICQKCEHYEGESCKLCGCNCPLKTAWRGEKCPDGRW